MTLNEALKYAALFHPAADYRLPERDALHVLAAAVQRVQALGSGPGFCMGDTTLISLGDVRAALRGKP